MHQKLNQAIDACVRDMARAIRKDGRPETASLWSALEAMDAVHVVDGRQLVEKAKFEWLREEALRRLVERLEQRLQSRLGPDPAISTELRTMFGEVLGAAE